MNDVKIVISKYKEDVSWVYESIYPTVIYDKSDVPIEGSVHRPNVGREAETLLYYIISNYERLPEITIFLQGDPRFNPVKYTYKEVVDKINNPHKPELSSFLEPYWHMNVDNYWEKSSGKIHNILFETDDKNVVYSSGVEYIIPKDNILNRPLEFYQHIHKSLLRFGDKPMRCFDNEDLKKLGISAWAIEPIWGCIFDKTLKLKNNYKNFL